ncbi:MAG TPA: hypothetical protein VLA17_01380, partial [Candidatus Limnocylindria bacterium]|nr:hypothetical protein [Candidatus Limnocylindria bacterium]
RLSPERDPRGLWGGVSARHVLAGSVLFMCLASYLAYVILTSRQTAEPAQISRVQPTTPPAAETPIAMNDTAGRPDEPAAHARPPVLDQRASRPSQRAKSERSVAAKALPSSGAGVPEPAPEEDVTADVMRSGNVVPNLTLKEVKKVYVEIRGGAALNELRSKLVENLNSSGVVAAATNVDDADAALKIVISQTSTSAQLVNARGTVLWPVDGRPRRYSGDLTKVLSEIVNDLLSEIREATK